MYRNDIYANLHIIILIYIMYVVRKVIQVDGIIICEYISSCLTLCRAIQENSLSDNKYWYNW